MSYSCPISPELYVDKLAAIVFRAERQGVSGQSASASSHVFELTTIGSGKLNSRGKQIPMTTHGKKTARRRPSRALSKFGPDHPVTRAAALYSSLVEEQGAVACSDPEGGASSGEGISDGGATSRLSSSQFLTHVQELIGDAVVLKAQRGEFKKYVRVREVVDGCVLDGKTVTEIVVRSGRSAKSTYAIKAVSMALEAALQRVADRNVL